MTASQNISSADMKAAGFKLDPTHTGHERWTHVKTGVTCLRQPYMTHRQWEQHKRDKLAEVGTSSLPTPKFTDEKGNPASRCHCGKHIYAEGLCYAHFQTRSQSKRATRYEDSPKLIVALGYFACPICRHTSDRKGQGDGFRKAGMKQHIWACWENSLIAAGLRIGDWSHHHNGYRICKARRARSSKPKKRGRP